MSHFCGIHCYDFSARMNDIIDGSYWHHGGQRIVIVKGDYPSEIQGYSQKRMQAEVFYILLWDARREATKYLYLRISVTF